MTEAVICRKSDWISFWISSSVRSASTGGGSEAGALFSLSVLLGLPDVEGALNTLTW